MLVVADSSPLIVLSQIARIEILPALFREVAAPPEVMAELRSPRRSDVVRAWIAGRPAWLIERTPASLERIPLLHPGELAAISLAIELHADLLLIDERRGRDAAVERRVPIAGTIGVLEIAAERGMLDLASAFEAIRRTDFWVSPALLNRRLKLSRSRPSGGEPR